MPMEEKVIKNDEKSREARTTCGLFTKISLKLGEHILLSTLRRQNLTTSLKAIWKQDSKENKY
jgi:hypothetical protein